MVALAGDGRTSLPGGRRNGVSTFRGRRRRKIAPEARRRGCYAGECAGLSGPIDMWRTWFYAKNMGAMVQIRNVPEALHRQLKSRAALAGMSLSDYLLSEIRQVAERPTIDELRARLRGRTETAPSVPPAEAVRAERDRA